MSHRLTLLFFDVDAGVVKAYRDILTDVREPGIRFKFLVTDVETIIRDRVLDAIVSPANSFGSMDGGIDEAYRTLFRGIEHAVKAKIRRLYPQNKGPLGNHMPVGDSLVVPTHHPRCPQLIVAPTMVHPSDINDTDNIKRAMGAILTSCRQMIKYLKRDIVVGCPGLGTGTGNMTGADSGAQILEALRSR